MPSTFDKAQELNLDPAIYGTFAEIGAGQETANWFFRASGSAGMVAKTISAYDMTMSDAIYGKCDRYVSRLRLRQMLDHEFSILLDRLGPKRGDRSTFFSFSRMKLSVRSKARMVELPVIVSLKWVKIGDREMDSIRLTCRAVAT